MATADDGTRELPVGIWEPGDTEPIGPLVVFSHGANGTMYNNESLFRELASHGYRVASVAHSKHTMFTRLSDGTIVTPDKQFLDDNGVTKDNKDSRVINPGEQLVFPIEVVGAK